MIDPVLLSRYQDVKQRIRETSDQLKEIFENILRSEEIVTDRPNDYGELGVFLNIVFDEINMKAFEPDKLEKMHALLVEFKKLRREQSQVENDMVKESSITQSIKNGVANSVGGFL